MADDNANENPETPSGLIVTLKSLDGVDFHLPLEAARLSDLCKAAIPEDLDEVTSIETIELLRVGARALEKIVAFMTHHNEEPLIAIPDPLPYATFDEVSCCWRAGTGAGLPRSMQRPDSHRRPSFNLTDRLLRPASFLGGVPIIGGDAGVVPQLLQRREHAERRVGGGPGGGQLHVDFTPFGLDLSQVHLQAHGEERGGGTRHTFEKDASSGPCSIRIAAHSFSFHSCVPPFWQIRDMLGLPELTPEEEQRAREEHPWLFENPTAT
jgi:Skp1 family, tetramerisation domain